MALYIALSLLAVMFALPASVSSAAGASHAGILFVTSIGLLIAHQLAFRLSARLAHGKLASEHAELLAAQLIGGLLVTVVAVVPVHGDRRTDRPADSRAGADRLHRRGRLHRGAQHPGQSARALLYVAGVVGLTLVIIGVKNLAHY